MNAGLIADSVIVVLSVAVTIIFYIYSKNKIAIDKKAMQGDALAKAEKMMQPNNWKVRPLLVN